MNNPQATSQADFQTTTQPRSTVIEVTPAAPTLPNAATRRHVKILTPQKGTYSDRREFDSDWPEELLYSLAALKGEWFLDSYQRFEHPNYIQKQIDSVLDLYDLKLGDDLILDFGCGFGASGYCMIKRGARRILASDLEKANTDFASEFFSGMGFADRVEIRCGDIVPDLQPASISIIWLQAVMEHLLPEERRTYLRRFWEALKPGGLLIITETPNRTWPIEGHTTGGTWGIPWMKPQRVFERMRRFRNIATIQTLISIAAASSARPTARLWSASVSRPTARSCPWAFAATSSSSTRAPSSSLSRGGLWSAPWG